TPEFLFVPPRGAEPRERHGAGVVPGVDDLGDPLRRAAALRAVDHHRVDVRAVRVQAGQVAPAPFPHPPPGPPPGPLALPPPPQGVRVSPLPCSPTAPGPRCCPAPPRTGRT